MNSDWIDGNQNFDRPADTLECFESEMAKLAKARAEGRMLHQAAVQVDERTKALAALGATPADAARLRATYRAGNRRKGKQC